MRRDGRRPVELLLGLWLLGSGCDPTFGLSLPSTFSAQEVTIAPAAQTLAIGDSVTLEVTIQPSSTLPLLWHVVSEGADLPLTQEDGASASVTAGGPGFSYVSAMLSDESGFATAIIKVLPLPFANECGADEECSGDMICRQSVTLCHRSCTFGCASDEDCPPLTRSSCNLDFHTCRAITNVDVQCPALNDG